MRMFPHVLHDLAIIRGRDNHRKPLKNIDYASTRYICVTKNGQTEDSTGAVENLWEKVKKILNT